MFADGVILQHNINFRKIVSPWVYIIQIVLCIAHVCNAYVLLYVRIIGRVLLLVVVPVAAVAPARIAYPRCQKSRNGHWLYERTRRLVAYAFTQIVKPLSFFFSLRYKRVYCHLFFGKSRTTQPPPNTLISCHVLFINTTFSGKSVLHTRISSLCVCACVCGLRTCICDYCYFKISPEYCTIAPRTPSPPFQLKSSISRK